MLRKRLLLIVSLFIFSLPFSGAVFAQVADQISVDIVPPNPAPNQSIIIHLQSYSFNINTADIEWIINGISQNQGIGLKSFKTTTGSLGKTTKVVAIVTPPDSLPITKTIDITPMSIDLLWQATDSVVPPFYRGKAMPTNESQIKVVAIPQILSLSGSLIAPESLVYTWQEGYTMDQPNSGYGKNAYLTEMDYLNDTKHLDVDVSSRDGAATTSGSLDISPVDPELILYASSPLYGPLTDTALSDSYTVSNNDTSIFAMPYFFSPGNPSSSALEYKWQLNGSDIDTPLIPNSLFLHRDSNSTGDATLDLAVTNTTKLFQSIGAHLNLILQ